MRLWIGVIVLLALVLIGSRRSAATPERRGVSMLIATGLPYVLFGAIAAHPSVDVLRGPLLENLRPVLEIALGAVGLRLGAQFDVRELERLPRGTGRLILATSVAAIALAGVGTLLVLAVIEHQRPSSGWLGDALILGACAAVSAPSGARALESVSIIDAGGSRLIRRIASLGSGAGMVVLALATALDLSRHSRFHLPWLAWGLLQIGLGVTVGLLALAIVRRSEGNRDEGAVFLGSIAFVAGAAGYVGFSPLVTGCFAGGILASARGGRGTGRFGDAMRAAERTMLLLCFVIVGALWQPFDARGWLLAPVFLLARVAGKMLGAHVARFHLLPDPEEVRSHEARVGQPSLVPVQELPAPAIVGTALVPMSAVSMAIVVSSAYGGESARAPVIATAVIGAGLMSEIAFRALVAWIGRSEVATS